MPASVSKEMMNWDRNYVSKKRHVAKMQRI